MHPEVGLDPRTCGRHANARWRLQVDEAKLPVIAAAGDGGKNGWRCTSGSPFAKYIVSLYDPSLASLERTKGALRSNSLEFGFC